MPRVPLLDMLRLKTYITGKSDGSLMAASTSGMQKMKAIRTTKPIRPLRRKVHIIARGTDRPASLTSSAMCAAASAAIYNQLQKHVANQSRQRPTSQCHNSRDLANHQTEARRGPASTIGESQQGSLCIDMRCEHTKDDYHRHKATYMHNHKSVLYPGHNVATPYVTDDPEGHHGQDKQRALPPCKAIVWVSKSNERLYHACGKETA